MKSRFRFPKASEEIESVLNGFLAIVAVSVACTIFDSGRKKYASRKKIVVGVLNRRKNTRTQ